MKKIFWRTANSGENWMQTLFRMLGNLAQWVFVFFIILICLIIVAEALPSKEERYIKKIDIGLQFTSRPENPFWAYEKVDNSNLSYQELITELISRDMSSPIKTTIDGIECNYAAPLMVTITNKGGRTIDKLDLFLKARQQGRSSDVLTYENRYRSLDFIIEPGETIQRCIPVTSGTSNDLIWEAKVLDVVIR